MDRPRFALEVVDERVARDLVAGGIVVPGIELAADTELELELHCGGRAVLVRARVASEEVGGAGLEILGLDGDRRERLAAFLTPPIDPAHDELLEQPADELDDAFAAIQEPATDPGIEPDDLALAVEDPGHDGELAAGHDARHEHADDNVAASRHAHAGDDVAASHDAHDLSASHDGHDAASDDPSDDAPVGAETDDATGPHERPADRRLAANIHERLRRLTMPEQIRTAQTGEVQERIVLERLYGKAVWEALLHNPRLTGPEVARIARMGTLPRVLLEVILNNGGWLQIPEVRRALLTCRRLGTDQILRVLRLLPKHELKLACVQTAYPSTVRDAARKLARES